MNALHGRPTHRGAADDEGRCTVELIDVMRQAMGFSERDFWECEQEADRIYRKLTGTEHPAYDART